MTKKAAAAAGKGFLKEAATGILKELGKEATKKALAEMIEGPYFRDYMNSQTMVAKAVGDVQSAGDLYWGTQDEIARTLGARDGILQRLAVEGFLVDRNEAFYAMPGYKLKLELMDDVDVSKFDARIWLGEIELLRDKAAGDLVWLIPKDAEYGFENPEFLPIRIEVK